MKNTRLIAGMMLFAFTSILSSCKKEQTTDEAEDMMNTEALSAFVEKSVSADEDASTMRGPIGSGGCNWQSQLASCALVTESGQAFPKTITIDYGEGCTNENGITKSGQIIIELSDEMQNTGAVRTVTFQNYMINNTQISGSRLTTNIGNNDFGQPQFSRVVNTTLARNGNIIVRTCDENVSWISGYDTEPCGDNIFSITGSGTSTRNDETTRIRVITEPLLVDQVCGYITEGIITIQAPKGQRSINFGDGACDDIAVVTGINGNTNEIHLHQN
jgi:hypothetical protein